MLIIQVKSFVSFFGTYFAYIIIKKYFYEKIFYIIDF